MISKNVLDHVIDRFRSLFNDIEQSKLYVEDWIGHLPRVGIWKVFLFASQHRIQDRLLEIFETTFTCGNQLSVKKTKGTHRKLLFAQLLVRCLILQLVQCHWV